MGEHTAFFYGTLMAPPVLHRVIYGTTTPEPWQAALTTVYPALLTDYRRHKVKHADYPAILSASAFPQGNNNTEKKQENRETPCVRGSLVTGLTEGDMWRLDVFEGSQYTRQKVKVKVLRDTALDVAVDFTHLEEHVEEEEVEAETYIWSDPVRDLEEEEWDFEVFRREKMWAWIGIGDGEVEVDEGFGDVDRAVREEEGMGKNDPTGGRGRGGRITRELEGTAV